MEKIDLAPASSAHRDVPELAERVPAHRHCKQCSRPVSMEDTFCSSGCEADFRNGLRRKKRQLYLYYLLIIMLLFLTLAYVGKL